MEGLSRCLIDERERGRLKDIKISENFILTHLLFVDDIIIFLNGSLGDITIVNSILQLFCKAIGMPCNNSKYTITIHGFSPHEPHFSMQWFPFSSVRFEDGLKYLGFHIKPTNYRVTDWTWLIAMIDKKLNSWHHR